MMAVAAEIRDRGHGEVISYSRKVFIPLTKLCRNSCHYCTFAHPPRRGERSYLRPEEVIAIAQAGAAAGCREALFTLGDKPELRYRAARDELAALGHQTTISYLAAMSALVLEQTGLLPHLNPGVMSARELADLRQVSVSQGLMLETAADRLSQRGGPHFGSPDKRPAVRLEMIKAAGEAAVPFTSGILIGIGETRGERLQALLHLRDLHERHGHLQEIIIQNFRAKPGTRMASHAEPDLDDHLWTIAAARILFGADMNIQAPPNLSPGVLQHLIAAGINDWGGVSPVTPDHVNPERPWPELDRLARETAKSGKVLVERLAIYPGYARQPDRWLEPKLRSVVLRAADAEGFARVDRWSPGTLETPSPEPLLPTGRNPLASLLDRAVAGRALSEDDVVSLFASRGDAFRAVCAAADALRQQVSGNAVSYVVTRNINYTNVCYYRCKFCAFSKGKLSANLRGRPYDLSLEEIQRRTVEAWDRGAVEVCLQGGIHPDYDGTTYLAICRAIKDGLPGDPHPCVFPARSLAGRRHARHLGARFPDRAEGRRARVDAGNGGRGARRRGPGGHLPRQGQHRAVAGGRRDRAPPRHQDDRDHHVRPRRWPAALGATSPAYPRAAGPYRRLHRIRSVAIRSDGDANPSSWAEPARTDISGSSAHACGGAAGASPASDEHPDLVGQDGPQRRSRLLAGGSERPRWHADEREHHPRRRRHARSGNVSGGDGGAHLLHRTATTPAHDALSTRGRSPHLNFIRRGTLAAADRKPGPALRADGRSPARPSISTIRKTRNAPRK